MTWHKVKDEETGSIAATELITQKEKPNHTIYVPVKTPLAVYDQAMAHILRLFAREQYTN